MKLDEGVSQIDPLLIEVDLEGLEISCAELCIGVCGVGDDGLEELIKSP